MRVEAAYLSRKTTQKSAFIPRRSEGISEHADGEALMDSAGNAENGTEHFRFNAEVVDKQRTVWQGHDVNKILLKMLEKRRK